MTSYGQWRPETFSGADGAALNVWRQPARTAGLPHLHFAHATGLNGFAYRRLLDPLAEHANLWAWDMRGHGRSNDVGLISSWTDYYADLACLLNHIGERCLLSGHSVGGMSSAAAAASCPDQVSALVLLDPVIMNGPLIWAARLAAMLGLRHKQPLAQGAAKRRRRFDSREAAMNAYRGRSIFKPWPDEWLADYCEVGFNDIENGVELACRPEFESNSFAHSELWPFRRINGIRCPTTVLCAQRGSTIGQSSRRILKRRCPQAEIRELPNSSHMLPIEYPDVIRAALVQHLQES